MTMRLDSPQLQEWGARALAELASSDAGSRAVVRAQGGCGAVVKAMATHATSPRVQFAGCFAVAALACDSPECQATLVERGVLPVVVNALRAFPADLHVQEWGCRALAALASEPASTTRAAIIEVRGFTDVVLGLEGGWRSWGRSTEPEALYVAASEGPCVC
jgi:hypothetical protein